MTLSMAAARDAIATTVAGPLGVDVTSAAHGIVDFINSQMATAVRLHAIERGFDPSGFSLFAFGGAGPVHAYDLARRVGIPRVICPPHAGVASAIGLLLAVPAVEVSQSHYTRLDRIIASEVRGVVARLEEQARAQIARMQTGSAVKMRRAVEMRYAGQGHTVSVELPDTLQEPVAASLRAAFETTYKAMYGHTLADQSIEALTWRVWLESERAHAGADVSQGVSEGGPPRKGLRQVFFFEAGRFLPCAVYERVRLPRGVEVQGPAIVEERECTLVIGPSGVGRVDDFLNLVMEIETRTASGRHIDWATHRGSA